MIIDIFTDENGNFTDFRLDTRSLPTLSMLDEDVDGEDERLDGTLWIAEAFLDVFIEN